MATKKTKTKVRRASKTIRVTPMSNGELLLQVNESIKTVVYSAINNHLTNWLNALDSRPKEAWILFMGVTLSGVDQPVRRRTIGVSLFDEDLEYPVPSQPAQVVSFLHGETLSGIPGQSSNIQIHPQCPIKKGCLIICFGAKMKNVFLGQKQQDIISNSNNGTYVARTLDTSSVGQVFTIELAF